MSRRPLFLERVIDRLIRGNALESASPRKSTRSAARPLAYQQHEERCLLASASFNPELGQLFINGSADADEVVVSQTGDTVTVVQPGFSDQTFAGSEIQKIVFNGNAGDDVFDNQTSIPTLANGGIGNDRLLGGSGNDRLIGSSGNDMLSGRAGDDYLLAGIGDDLLLGGDGDDELLGTRSRNELFGGNGNDVIRGGSDGDIIEGGDGNDKLFGNAGDDRITGGSGIDRIFAGFGDDTVDGNDGDDIIRGQQGDDVLVGGDGNDVLVGGTGDDLLNGQSGIDSIRGDHGSDAVALHQASEVYRVSTAGPGFRVTSLLEGSATNRDTTRSVEQLNFNDVQLEPTAAVALTGANTTTSAGTSGSSNLVAGPGTSGSRLPTLGPGSSIVPRVIREVVTVQPIIAANDDGSNQAEYFGNGEQQAEIFDQIDRIYAAAQVDIQFLPPRYVNNTFINIGDEPEGVTRGFDEEEIVVLGDELGVGNRDRLVLDVYFVQRVPGSEIGVLGIVAAIGGNGAVVESGEDLNTEQGRRNIATTTAHEIGHNLGLTHADGNDLTNNLMFPFAGAGTADELTNDFVQPPLMIPELNFFAPGGGQLDVIIASPFSVPVA